jgi:ribonucleotide reductase class II
MQEFRPSAPSAETVFYRTYSRRKADGTRENFQEAMTRTVEDIARIGKFTIQEAELVKEQALAQHAFPSGRAFWVAGTEWGKKPENFSGYYNCTSTHIEDLDAFGLLVDLAMQGSGTGAVLEQSVIDQLPEVENTIDLVGVSPVGTKPAKDRSELTKYETLLPSGVVFLSVGDSRQGWRDAYQFIVNLACRGLPRNGGHIRLHLDLSNVRPAGERLQGFGGTSNPVNLEQMFQKIINLLNKANGRKLTTVEACLLIDEAAACIVAGNIRRSAGMRQFSENDSAAAKAKLGLYSQDDNGKWRVDPEKEALRMANHTLAYHTKPDYGTIETAVYLQLQSGEGAIQYVPEAVARANADLLNTPALKSAFPA